MSPQDGWGKPKGSDYWHYFRRFADAYRSLWEAWHLNLDQNVQPGNDEDTHNCDGCRRSLKTVAKH